MTADRDITAKRERSYQKRLREKHAAEQRLTKIMAEPRGHSAGAGPFVRRLLDDPDKRLTEVWKRVAANGDVASSKAFLHGLVMAWHVAEAGPTAIAAEARLRRATKTYLVKFQDWLAEVLRCGLTAAEDTNARGRFRDPELCQP